MNLFKKLKNTLEKTVSPRSHSIKTAKSLKAIMEAIDFNVYRYRTKTGKTILGPRGGKQDQRKLQDCTIIEMPDNYVLFAFNIDQFLEKVNWKYPTVVTWPNGEKQKNNIRVPYPKNFDLTALPQEILNDLGIKPIESGEKGAYKANKSGYAAFILKDGKLYPLRKTKYASIKIKGSPSKKMIYREKRDWNLEDSFIKVVWAYILSTVTSPDGKPLIEMDIDPKNYIPRKENSENWNKETKNNILKKETLDLDEIEDNLEENNKFNFSDLAEFITAMPNNKEISLKKLLKELGIKIKVDDFKLTATQLKYLLNRMKQDLNYDLGDDVFVTDFLKEIEKIKNKDEKKKIVKYEYKWIFNSDDLDASKEYCEENNVKFSYNGETGTMTFEWEEEEIEKIKELFWE